MSIQLDGIDAKRCERRNKIMSARGTNVVPLRILAGPPSDPPAAQTFGSLPSSQVDVLAAIQAHQPPGAEKLTLDDVYTYYLEAANTQFVQKYWMFLSPKTLKNFAADAAIGLSFMNSHATGSLSGPPAQLPMGLTFGGTYNRTSDGSDSALLGVYALRGIYPNGEGQGPSTDTMHKQINAGIIKDVSVGIPRGSGVELCAVCENPLNARDEQGMPLCSHIPGTPRNMTADDRKRLKTMGVPNGYAAFILDDAHLSEVSAVYDGALPGAGVRKVLSMARQRRLTADDIAAARSSYGYLLAGRDLQPMDDVSDMLEGAVERGMNKALDNTPQPKAHSSAAVATDDVTTLKAQLAAQGTRMAQMEKQMRQERANNSAEGLILREQQNHRHYPAATKQLRAFSRAVYLLSEENPQFAMTSAENAQISLAAGFEAYLASVPPHNLDVEQMGDLGYVSDRSAAADSDKALFDAIDTIIERKNKAERKDGGK